MPLSNAYAASLLCVRNCSSRRDARNTQRSCAEYAHTINGRGMDRTIQQEDIQEVLRNFDRKKESEKKSNINTEALNISSAIGTETPMTVLIDIRQCICELTDTVKKSNEDAATREERSLQRHMELLAYISGINDTLQKQRSESHTSIQRGVSLPIHTKQEQREYFYCGDKLSTKNAVMGCVLMQIYNAVVRQMSETTYHQTDATPMELKHWSTLVTIVAEAESNTTHTNGKLTLPKQNSSECITASELVASTVPGRSTSCTLKHLRRLQEECPSIIAAVNEIIERIIACPGLISSSRSKCLNSLSFPLITRDGTLNVSGNNVQKGATKIVLDIVSSLNVPQRKQYASKVLRDNVKPLVAAKDVEKLKLGAGSI